MNNTVSLSERVVVTHPSSMPGPRASGIRTLTLNGLKVSARIGILAHEIDTLQTLRVDVSINLGAQTLLPVDDDIVYVLDYRRVRDLIVQECSGEHVNLLETRVGRLAHCLQRLPGARGVWVRATKIEAFDDCEVAIGVQAGSWPAGFEV